MAVSNGTPFTAEMNSASSYIQIMSASIAKSGPDA